MAAGAYDEARLRDRFRGALLGTMVGDALGLPMEGKRTLPEGQAPVRDFKPLDGVQGRYSDDSEMTMAFADALVRGKGEPDPERIAASFGTYFSPERGYGTSAWQILDSIRRGLNWREAVSRSEFKLGSWGNGSAMRVAPAALVHLGQEDRVRETARLQAEITNHTHPLAVWATEVQALAVHQALITGIGGEAFDGRYFLDTYLVARLPDEAALRDELAWIRNNIGQFAVPEAITRFGTGIKAPESVCAALWFFLVAHEQGYDAEDAIVFAANHSRDSDTIAAMTGAIAGAYWGAKALPSRWIESLENGGRGRDKMITLADRLADMAIERLNEPGFSI